MSAPYKVLVIDDDWQPDFINLQPDVTHPRDDSFGKTIEAMGDYEVILIDQNLGLEPPLSLTASDGTSLVGHFRSWARRHHVQVPPLVITTSNAEAFANEVPVVGPPLPLRGTFAGREHRLAPTLDVEWLLAKSDSDLTVKISSLAAAWRCLGGTGSGVDWLREPLGLTETGSAGTPAWYGLIDETLREARAPVLDEGAAPASLAGPILRWLLHRALPYPGLFVSDVYAAWSLGVTKDSLVQHASQNATTNDPLMACRYRGILASLFPRRWWSVGINTFVWELDQELSGADVRGSSRQVLLDKKVNGKNLVDRPTAGTIVVCDVDLQETGEVDIADAVELRPPGWPIEAIPPWADAREAKNDPILRSMAVTSAEVQP